MWVVCGYQWEWAKEGIKPQVTLTMNKLLKNFKNTNLEIVHSKYIVSCGILSGGL